MEVIKLARRMKEMDYPTDRNCPCIPGDDFPECSTHGIVARGGTAEEQEKAVEADIKTRGR